MLELDFRLHFERAPARLLILAPDAPRYTILGASDLYLDATLTTRDIVSYPLFEVFPDNPAAPHANGRRNLDASLQRALARKGTDVMPVQRYDVRDRSGGYVERHWSPVNAPIVSSEGAVVTLIHRVEDVTELVHEGEILEGEAARLEHEIIVRNRELAAMKTVLHDNLVARQRFVAMMSHDLRTPLAAVQNAAHVLTQLVARRELPEPATLRRLQFSIGRLTGMLHDLDDYILTEVGGRLPVCPEHANVRALCETAVEEARLANPTRIIKLEPGDNLAADVDPRRFHQVLQNLIANALTYGAQGRPVRVSLASSTGFCIVTVSNEGEAIPVDLVPVLFEPSRRGRSTNGERHMGLGLFIVKQIAQAHGGAVEVKSSPQGTHFAVRFPCKSS